MNQAIAWFLFAMMSVLSLYGAYHVFLSAKRKMGEFQSLVTNVAQERAQNVVLVHMVNRLAENGVPLTDKDIVMIKGSTIHTMPFDARIGMLVERITEMVLRDAK